MTYVTYALNEDIDDSVNESSTTRTYDVEETQTLLSKEGRTPLPKLQIVTLCFVRLADPISLTQIFPYINEMMDYLHVTDKPSQIGFYSGLVDSIFAVAQLGSLYHFGQLSDRVGRRPVILLGLLCVAMCNMAFGLSTSFFLVCLTRFVGGAFSGNLSVIHTSLGEMTDSTNESTAFSWYGLIWPLGSIIGPMLGGSLSRPADKFPSLFNTPFHRTYPYFLPCFVASLITFLSVLVGYLFLKETHPTLKFLDEQKSVNSKVHTDYGTVTLGATNATSTVLCTNNPSNPTCNTPSSASTNISVSVTGGNVEVITPTLRSLLALKPIRTLCTSGFSLSFTAMAFDVVFVLFCFSRIEDGGLSFSPEQIGFALAIAGMVAGCLQFIVMPLLLTRFSTVKLYLFCMCLWPVNFAMMPLLNIWAKMKMKTQVGIGGTLDEHAMAVLWIGIFVVLVGNKFGCLAYTLSMLLTKAKTPDRSMLGSTNGLVQSTMCLARAFSPALVSSLYAWSSEKHILGGNLIWVVMVMISFLGMFVTTALVDPDEK